MRILYLLTDGYGGYGGIALYNRDVLEAMAGDPTVERIVAVPRIIGEHDSTIDPKIEWKEAAAGSIAGYILHTLRACLTERPFDVIYCAHVNLLPVARMAKALTGAPMILALYGFEAWDPFERFSSRQALPSVDHILSISDYTWRRFAEWSKVDARRMTLVPNAIHLNDFSAGPKNPALEQHYGIVGRKVAMLFGRMNPTERRKGFDELIEALPQLRERDDRIVLMLAGGGDDMPRLKAKAAHLNVADTVIFTGMIDEQAKADHFRLADAYVMPSRQEGFGYVHLEAMACGIPAVASGADGAREAVRDGMLGEVIDPDDRQQIVDATLRAMQKARGVPPGLDFFGYDRFSDRIRSMIQKLVTNPAR